MTRTNSELLATGRDLHLGGLEGQRRFVLRKLTQRMGCPNCATPQNYVEAAGLTVDTVDLDKAADDPCKCVACGRGLIYTVLMFGDPVWTLVPINLNKDEGDGNPKKI